MEHAFIIEIIALIIGLAVIAIETVIIFMLRNHVKILDQNLKKDQEFMIEFKKNIHEHLDHLDDHSHDIEEKLEHFLDKFLHKFHLSDRETSKEKIKFEENRSKKIDERAKIL